MLSRRIFLAVMIWLPFCLVAQTQRVNTTDPCNVPPFSVQLKDQSIGDSLMSWGVLFFVGGPEAQRVSLVPSTVVSSTLVNQNVDNELCRLSNTTIRNQCVSIRGGFYDESQSSTWRPQPDLKNSNISREEPTWDHFNEEKQLPDGLRIEGIKNIGYDNIAIHGSEDFTLQSAGIALNRRGNQSNAGMLGLGLESVFLDDVVGQKRAPSRSWGLDAGSRSSSGGRAGELVIGGWNKGRVEDEDWVEFNVSKDTDPARPCPLTVHIKELIFVAADGVERSPLKHFANTISACIEPYDDYFRWQSETIKEWKEKTGFNERLVDPYTMGDQGLAFVEPGLPYEKSKVEEWQLKIVLDGGYETTIGSDEMTRDLKGWNKNGELKKVPDISNVAIFSTGINDNETTTLGRTFLSRTYLRVDYERDKFYLAPSRSDASVNSANSGLEPMLPPRCDATQEDSGGTPVGPIVGGVVGGVAAAILSVAFLVWFGKRRRNREKRKQEMGFRVPSRSGSNDPEPAFSGSLWPGYIGPPVERDREHSYATTLYGQRVLSGAGLSPRTTAQDLGTRGGRMDSTGSDISPMTRMDYHTPAELEASKREVV